MRSFFGALLLIVGTASLSQASMKACMEYLQNQYPYPNTVTASQLCRGDVNVECIRYLKDRYPYPSAPAAAEMCKGGVEVDCIQYLTGRYPYPSTIDAAKLCVTGSCRN